MNQLTFNSDFVRVPGARVRSVVKAVTKNLAVAAVIAVTLALCIGGRVVAAALANRELMEALRLALLRAAEAMKMFG
jgi:hypothetical protein